MKITKKEYYSDHISVEVNHNNQTKDLTVSYSDFAIWLDTFYPEEDFVASELSDEELKDYCKELHNGFLKLFIKHKTEEK